MSYYNDDRCHWSLEGKTPREKGIDNVLKSININELLAGTAARIIISRYSRVINGLYWYRVFMVIRRCERKGNT